VRALPRKVGGPPFDGVEALGPWPRIEDNAGRVNNLNSAKGVPRTDDLDLALREMGEAMRGLQGLRAPRLFATELTMSQLKVLFVIWENPELTGSQLAARLRVGAPTVSSLVDRLVGQGYVRREPDPVDRRVVRLEATPAGRELVTSLFLDTRERLADILRSLTPAELAVVARAFGLLRVAVEQHRARAAAADGEGPAPS
jgi:DNA-binding MarR family transcriptional regulator